MLVLSLLSVFACVSSECVGSECVARYRSASLLQIDAQRGITHVIPRESDMTSASDIMATSPEELLQLAQSVTADMMLANGSSASDPTILGTIQKAVGELVDNIIAETEQQQTKLDAANKALRQCPKEGEEEVDMESSEPETVHGWHARHSNCREQQSILATEMKKQCDDLHDLVARLGWPSPNPEMDASATAVEHWRAYLDVVAPIIHEEEETFRALDEACSAATALTSAKNETCNSDQGRYETSVCEFVTNGGAAHDGLAGCLEQRVPIYNDTIQEVSADESKRIADYTSLMRVLCYVTAQGRRETFAEATHFCHDLSVDTTPAKIRYPGWPLMPEDMDDMQSSMYPCGAVWTSFAYGSLPHNAPANKCEKCPDLPDLNGAGGVFVRWGGVTCPEPATMIYEGIAAGSRHSESGNGANLLCLVKDPSDAPATSESHNNRARLYGVQYYDMYAGKSVNNQDAGCATCAFSGTTYNVWGSVSCGSHTTLYTGNVMSSHHGHQTSEFVCVDKERSPHYKSDSADNAATLWYLAEYETGALPSSVYDGQNEVACAMCGIPDSNEAVYTRWGHDECVEGSSLIYTGAVGGSHYGHHGGGYNSICLTLEPSDAPDMKTGNQNAAHIYGTEYQDRLVGESAEDRDAACAVCAYSGKTTYNAWGTTECGDDHELLYKGNVYADYHGHHRKQFVCVDPARKGHAKSSQSNHNGHLWYPAEYDCGAMPCGEAQFDDQNEVACAVCGVPEGAGSVFTRWGHMGCPEKAHLVYEGVAAGAYYNHGGGAADSICVSKDSTLAPDNQAGAQNRARVYGIEYEDSFGGSPNHNNWDAGCAVCAYEGSATYDSWGKVSCEEDHEVLYKGNVMAGYHSYQKQNYVCVDEERQGHFANDKGDNNGALWYTVEYECGSIPCEPYDATSEAACAKCGIPGLTGGRKSCHSYSTRTTCPRARCSWMGHSCKKACSLHKTNVTCPAGCTWEEEHEQCYEPCEDFTSVDDCPVGRCAWKEGTCTRLSNVQSIPTPAPTPAPTSAPTSEEEEEEDDEEEEEEED